MCFISEVTWLSFVPSVILQNDVSHQTVKFSLMIKSLTGAVLKRIHTNVCFDRDLVHFFFTIWSISWVYNIINPVLLFSLSRCPLLLPKPIKSVMTAGWAVVKGALKPACSVGVTHLFDRCKKKQLKQLLQAPAENKMNSEIEWWQFGLFSCDHQQTTTVTFALFWYLQ